MTQPKTILKPQSNIWDYAWREVDKPDAITQIKHSASYRSLVKITSTRAGAFSAIKDVAQQAAAFIPLPVIGSIISNLLGSIHSAARSARIEKRLSQAKAAGDLVTQMKFMLKTLDTGTLREHCKKSTEAFKIMIDGIENHKAHVAYAQTSHAVCPELLKRAKQIMYTRKHLNRLENEAADLMECAKLLAEYARELNEVTQSYEKHFVELWSENIPKTFPDDQEYRENPFHANCLNNGYCVVTTQVGGAAPVMPGVLKTGLKTLFKGSATLSIARQTGSYIGKS